MKGKGSTCCLVVSVNEVGGKGLEGKAYAGLETTEEGAVGIAKG
jgi:hypothetical protein